MCKRSRKKSIVACAIAVILCSAIVTVPAFATSNASWSGNIGYSPVVNVATGSKTTIHGDNEYSSVSINSYEVASFLFFNTRNNTKGDIMSGEAKVYTGESGSIYNTMSRNDSISLLAHREYIWDSPKSYGGRWTP